MFGSVYCLSFNLLKDAKEFKVILEGNEDIHRMRLLVKSTDYQATPSAFIQANPFMDGLPSNSMSALDLMSKIGASNFWRFEKPTTKRKRKVTKSNMHLQ